MVAHRTVPCALLTEVINGVTTTYTYTYDEDNRVTNVAIGDLKVSYTYDGFGRLESRTVKNRTGDGSVVPLVPTYGLRSLPLIVGSVYNARDLSTLSLLGEEISDWGEIMRGYRFMEEYKWD